MGLSARSLRSCLYAGVVVHERLRPVRHRFRYRVFSLLLDLDELEAAGRATPLFRVGRRGLLSFREADHGPRDGSPLRPWVDARLEEIGVRLARPRVELLCFPRVLGWVFDPLSVYFCSDGNALRAVIYEVKNTFGGQRAYALPVTSAGGPVRQSCDKDFYVSPFMPMAMRYHFRLRAPDSRLGLLIRETDAEGTVFVASHTARRQPLTTRSVLARLAATPFLTLKVVAGIHGEALRLWLKGAPLHPGATVGRDRA